MIFQLNLAAVAVASQAIWRRAKPVFLSDRKPFIPNVDYIPGNWGIGWLLSVN